MQNRIKHKRIKALLIVTDLERGGTPLQVYRLAKGLKSLNTEIAVCCLSHKGPIAELIEQEAINVYPLQATNITDVQIIFKLAKLINNFKPDICNSFLMHSNVITRIAARLLSSSSCKIISTVCTVERQKHWHMIMENSTHRLSDIIVCISQAVLKHLHHIGHIPKNKLELIYPGIDIQKIRNAVPIDIGKLSIRPCKHRICFLGRLDPIKRIDLILHAIRKIHNEQNNYDIQFIIIGDGPERNKLERLTKELKIENIVYFLGFREDYPAILKLCQIYTLASEQEGWGIATIEAIAAGLIPVVSDIDGSREIIEKTSGLTFTPKDSDDLAAKIIKAINLYDNRQFAIDNENLAFFDYHRESSEYLKLYETLLYG